MLFDYPLRPEIKSTIQYSEGRLAAIKELSALVCPYSRDKKDQSVYYFRWQAGYGDFKATKKA